jgi:hypothetical protein
MFDKLRYKIASSLVGGTIKSVPNISIIRDIGGSLYPTAIFSNLDSYRALEKEYRENPVLSAVINRKAEYASNAIIKVRNVKNGEIFTDKEYLENKNIDPIVRNMFKLKNNPNPLQSTKEFLALRSIFKDVFGNGYIYANSANSRITIKDVAFMWHVWPQWMKPELTGKYFDQLNESDIIKLWKWEQGTFKKEFNVDEILHRKEPNIRLIENSDLVLGESRQISIAWALSNIKIAYESRNVIAKHRGMNAIISSDMKDGFAGSMPMSDTEKEEVQEDLKERYGFLHNQHRWMVTRQNVKVTPIDQDVRKLGLLNEIASDAMIVAERYGVPETLIKLYQKGATFENQDTAERRMYQNTTIPEETDFWNDINVWLKCREFGYEYLVCFDHIPVLQEDMKQKSDTNKIISAQYKEMFLAGAITYNQWLQAVGLPLREDGNRYITQMSMEEIQKIKGNYTINNSLDKTNAE